ncbi:hypothetical protein [Protaetiibacter mangrovi]|uniref:Uncharacterized protein n=1 Tax=Protaetiibacter mangrovi TaxID=2970926 RepID=A0ABT1ZHL2_9MICO|nr:hypothetical protein [Protaetiibacter mangrovi]MCS0500203.1 hypothetical protein [Protaetiibacter mangrovi]TPX02441.1 hypothetical protein FJ656_22370 [Schumannella luteola]
MTTLTPSPVLATGVRIDTLVRAAAGRASGALAARADRPAVTNEVAPLILVAVIAVAAALALIAIIGAVATWIYYCQAYFGPNFWPAVSWPGQSGGLFYLACKRV